jgi:hypothetical protein
VTWLCKPSTEQSKFDFPLGRHNRTLKLYLEQMNRMVAIPKIFT